MTTFEDYYETLQVSPTAEPEVIEAAYKKLADEYATDRNNEPAAAETMSKIAVAYDVLKDPSRRKRYDQDLLLERELYPTEYGLKDKADDVPKYKAEYVPAYKDKADSSRGLNSRRIAIIILLVADIALASIFVLTPFIGLFITQNTWILYVLFTLFGALVASLIFADKFRHVLVTLLKSWFRSTQRWITSDFVNNNFLDRFLVFVLIVILIALIVYIYVIPWVYQIWAKGSVIDMVLFGIALLLIGILLTSRRFWRYCFNNSQSIRSKSASYIPKKSSAEYNGCPTSATYIPKQSSHDSANLNISEWTWAPGQMTDSLSASVWNAILNFRPSKQYGRERGYHDELFNYLKIRFHPAQSNKRKGSSQPDIHIEHIAIEIKGPTGKSQIVTLTDKAVRYLARGHHTILFIVLFQPSREITPAYFQEFKNGLLNMLPKVGVITKRGN